MTSITNVYRSLLSKRWELGIVENSFDSIISGEKLHIKWIQNNDKSHWYADPFVLDVTDKEIVLLAEDMNVNTSLFQDTSKKTNATISILIVDKSTFEIIQRKEVLKEDTHLSFPNVYRKGDGIYIYPENAHGGRLALYEYDKSTERFIFCKKLINEPCWDSVITDIFGEKLCFTAKQNDFFLDIYKWDEKQNLFVFWQSIKSDKKNMRLAGQFFEVDGKIYCPFQNNEKGYGNAIEIKEVIFKDNKFSFNLIRTLRSTHPYLMEGMHTLNEYKGIIVIDVLGYQYKIGKLLHGIIKPLKILLHGKC